MARGHGRRYVGSAGRGFRTDRCLRDWASDPLAIEATVGHSWLQSPGGGFSIWAGDDPPALLMDAIELYAIEAQVCDARERETRQRALDADREANEARGRRG